MTAIHRLGTAAMRLLPPENFGAALHYFTGSKSHNIEMRKRGNRMGIKVSDKGVFTREDERLIDPCPEEADVFRHLGLPWIPPELRENRGNIALLQRAEAVGLLPKGVGQEAADAYRELRHIQHRARLDESPTQIDATAAAGLSAAVRRLWSAALGD